MLGSYQTVEFIETFVNYHENIKKCVCVVYDPYRSSKGTFALKAIRLKDTFIEHFKQQKLSTKDLREVNLLWRDVFQVSRVSHSLNGRILYTLFVHYSVSLT